MSRLVGGSLRGRCRLRSPYRKTWARCLVVVARGSLRRVVVVHRVSLTLRGWIRWEEARSLKARLRLAGALFRLEQSRWGQSRLAREGSQRAQSAPCLAESYCSHRTAAGLFQSKYQETFQMAPSCSRQSVEGLCPSKFLAMSPKEQRLMAVNRLLHLVL